MLVVDVGDVPDRGYWGEVLTTAAQARGLAGLVIDGGVRDVAALERLAFPVFSRGVALPGATKRNPGTRRARGHRSPASRSRRATGWSATSTGWSWSGVPRSTRRSPPVGPGLPARSEYFAALRQGATTVELLHLDASLIDRAGPADLSGAGPAPAAQSLVVV